MSGGSFDYVCFKLGDAEIFEYSALENLRKMERYLRGLDKQLAADEIFKLILEIETAKRHIEIMGNRLHDLVYATEWQASGDCGIDAIDKAIDKLLGKET